MANFTSKLKCTEQQTLQLNYQFYVKKKEKYPTFLSLASKILFMMSSLFPGLKVKHSQNYVFSQLI